MKPISIVRNKLPRSGIREIMEKALLMEDVIHLEVGEPNVATPSHICEAAYKAMDEGFTHYTSNAGLDSLRRQLAIHLQKQYELNIDKTNIIVTPGAVTALNVSLLALVDSGEEVLIPDPGWPNYEQMILNQEAIPVRYNLIPENGFIPDFDHLEKVVTNKTKVMMINTPGNPTGGIFDKETIQKILLFAKKHDLYIISDEVYDGIIFDGKHVSPKTFDDNDRVLSVYSFSKNYAMTGWRLGYAAVPQHIAEIMSKTLELMVSCASSVSQKAGEAALFGPQTFLKEMQEIYKDRCDKAYRLLEDNGLKAFKPKGAFYMMIDLSELDKEGSELALSLLQEERVAVAPGTTFGNSSKNMVRISLATEESQLLEGISRICNFVNKNRKAKKNVPSL
ncbi:pyridoxal phosphate-dependent aminotransferase [Cytobacillus sp. FJAT-53684]|uniref:Aminotransferase n=1 Tax=Cytobacillus mangrovibacter TaxID=3299024 RepID=A0ABW6K2M3_9BACI